MKTLEQQLHEYGEYQNTLHGPTDFNRVTARPLIASEPEVTRGNRVWVVVAAAAVAAIVVGAIPLLVRVNGAGSATDSNPAVPVTTPSTSVTIPPGSRLAFVPTALPAGDPSFRGGVWYRGALYAVGDDGRVYSTGDGFEWQVETVFDRFLPVDAAAAGFGFVDIVTDGARLVVVGSSEHDTVGGERCSTPGHLLRVIVLNPDGSATSSDVPTPSALVDDVCTSVNLGVTVGPVGVVVSGSISTHPPQYTERAVGLWSADGVTWTDMGRVPPFHSAQVRVVATSDGFRAWPTGPDDNGPVYASEDGVSWEAVNGLDEEAFGSVVWWRELSVMRGSSGVVTVDESAEVLVEASDLPRASRLFFGQMGIVGAGTGGYGNDVPSDQPFSFSVHGKVWNHWTPEEFQDLDTMLTFVGMGDTFVVLYDWKGQQLWIGTPTE